MCMQKLPDPVDMDRPSHPLEEPTPTQKQIKSLDDEIASGQYGGRGLHKGPAGQALEEACSPASGPGTVVHA